MVRELEDIITEAERLMLDIEVKTYGLISDKTKRKEACDSWLSNAWLIVNKLSFIIRKPMPTQLKNRIQKIMDQYYDWIKEVEGYMK